MTEFSACTADKFLRSDINSFLVIMLYQFSPKLDVSFR